MKNTLSSFTKKITTTAIGLGMALTASAQTSQADKIHLGLLYPLSTHGTHAPLDTNAFSLNLISGVSAEEKGVAFAGFSTIVKNNTNGIAFSGFSNHIDKQAEGLLFAGFINTYQSGKGMQFAGFTNVAGGNVEGSQFAGFANTAAGVTGSQFAGFTNAAKAVKGSQFAGFSNIVKGDIVGSQLSGFINVSKNVTGSQVAGFINVAKKVKGAQIAGFINIADSSDHPIGIINIIKNGEKSFGFSVDETQTVMASFRSGGKVLYGIIGAGYNFKNEEEVYAFEAGLGAHLLRTSSFRLNTELATQYIEGFHPGEYFKSSLKVLPAVRMGKHVEIFGGPAFQFINTNTEEGKSLTRKYIWEKQNRWDDNFRALYIGYTAGINFIF